MSIQPTDGQQPAAMQPVGTQSANGQHVNGQHVNGQHVKARPRLAAVPHAEQQGAPARLRRSFGGLLRARRIRNRLALIVLAIEQHLIGATRASGTASYAENVIRAIGKAAGDRVIARFQRVLSGLAGKADQLRAEQQSLRLHARYRDGNLFPHPDGGVRTVAQTSRRPGQAAGADRSRHRPRLVPAPAPPGCAPPGPGYGLRRRRAAAAVLLFRRDQRQLVQPVLGRPRVRVAARHDGHRHQLRVLPLHRRPAAAVQGRHRRHPAARSRRGHHRVDRPGAQHRG